MLSKCRCKLHDKTLSHLTTREQSVVEGLDGRRGKDRHRHSQSAVVICTMRLCPNYSSTRAIRDTTQKTLGVEARIGQTSSWASHRCSRSAVVNCTTRLCLSTLHQHQKAKWQSIEGQKWQSITEHPPHLTPPPPELAPSPHGFDYLSIPPPCKPLT